MSTDLLYGMAIGSGLGLLLGVWMVRRYKKLLTFQADSILRPGIKIMGRTYFMVPEKEYLTKGKKTC